MTQQERDTYQSVAGHSEGLYKEKGSKFIAHAWPVSNQDEIKARLEELRKQYYDARHHCYAWQLGKEGQPYRANDDGEPNHSAGDPILGQLRSFNVSDVLVVVVRYFGGTKLGVSGLINAYRTAAAEALEAATIVTKVLSQERGFTFQYPEMNEVMKLVKDFDLEIIAQDFAMSCAMTLRIRERDLVLVQDKLSKIDGLTFDEDEPNV